MKIVSAFLMISIVFSTIVGCSSVANTVQEHVQAEQIEQAQIKNLHTVNATTFASGQPTKVQIQALAKAGIKHIINLRSPHEQDWNEGTYVRSLGIQYHTIPIAGAADITHKNAQRLAQRLGQLDNEPVLVHCASGNRVGALAALSAGEAQGHNIEAAIAQGRRWGLTRLESVVRERLSENR